MIPGQVFTVIIQLQLSVEARTNARLVSKGVPVALAD
jgi:hypothetical protein